MARKAKARGGKAKPKSGSNNKRAKSKARPTGKASAPSKSRAPANARASGNARPQGKVQASGNTEVMTTSNMGASAPPPTVPSDALADARRLREEEDAKLRADPWFMRAVARGKSWEAAQAGVASALAPYRAAMDQLIRDHGNGYPPDSPIAQDFDDLKQAMEKVKLDTFAAHGFPPAKDPRTPEDIAAQLAGLNPDVVIEQARYAGVKDCRDAYEKESLQLWQAAEDWLKDHPALPRLPLRPERGVDRLALLRPWCEGCAVAEAYVAASQFLEHWRTLSHVKAPTGASPVQEPWWHRYGGTYAMGFIAWLDLTPKLTEKVRNAARSIYAADARPIRIGKLKPKQSLIEAIVDEMGIVYRNALYAGMRHPFEPNVERITQLAKDTQPLGYGEVFERMMKAETRETICERLGVKTTTDEMMLISADWKTQTAKRGEAAMQILECRSIDFDELLAGLGREGLAATKVGMESLLWVRGTTSSVPRPPSEAREAPILEHPSKPGEVWKRSYWFVQAWHEYHIGEGRPLSARRLRQAKDRKRIRGRQPDGPDTHWWYEVGEVCSDLHLKVFADCLRKAIENNFDPPERSARGDRKSA